MTDLDFATVQDLVDELEARFTHVLLVYEKETPTMGTDKAIFHVEYRGSMSTCQQLVAYGWSHMMKNIENHDGGDSPIIIEA